MRFFCLVFAVLGWTAGSSEALSLPKLLSDGMVLQRDREVPIWGQAEPGERVTVGIDGKSREAVADQKGQWRVLLPAHKAGGPFRLTVEGSRKIVLEDIYIGEVWVCSGQSNMNMGVVKTLNADKEIQDAKYPQIRLLTVPQKESADPLEDVDVRWTECSPRTVSYFSATAYYFGRELHKKLGVPVGLIASSVNGTRIEPWTPGVGVSSVPALQGVDRPVNGLLYNGMIHPLTRHAIRGVIWYQGEGNVGDGSRYTPRMKALIQGWRECWQQPDFPFYYVQLAPLNWGGKPKDQHAELWEAQSDAMTVPNTGMIVTNDIGNIGDAHPKNKQEVGRRLSLWALAKIYGDDKIVYSGPVYREMKIEEGRIRLHFDHLHGGLVSRDGKALDWFTIAGKDGKFLPAQAQIDGETVVVSHPDIAQPQAVRFAWHQNAQPNLMNKAGFPTSAFRTDKPAK